MPALLRYTRDEVLQKYMVFCKKNVNSIPEINWDDFCDGDDAGADGEAKEEPDLDDLEDDEADAFDHEETVELPAAEGPDLSGADLECFELLSQIKAREAADSIGWMELEEGDGAEKLESISDSAAQRLGCSQSARSLPPPMLDSDVWNSVLGVDDGPAAEQQPKVAKTSKMLTLAGVFARVRVGDQELKSMEPVIAPLWQCLVNLRTEADSEVLPRPEKFRVTKKKLNWFNLAERQAACVRAVVGLPSKRTSRAYAWRNMAASFQQSIEWKDEDKSVEVASGTPVLYVPPHGKQIKLGLVLTVWRYTALKKKKWGAKPCTMPVPKPVARYVRITEMLPVSLEVEGWFRCSSESHTAVCDMNRVILFLKTEDAERSNETLRLRLCEKSLEAYQKSRAWKEMPETDETGEQQKKTQRGKQAKRKAEAMEAPDCPDDEGDAQSAEEIEVEDGKEISEKNQTKKPLKSLSAKPDKPKSKKLEEIPVPWIIGMIWMMKFQGWTSVGNRSQPIDI